MKYVFLSAVAALPLLTGCSDFFVPSIESNILPAPGGTLQVVTSQGSTTYYIGRDDNPVGPEAFLIQAFASKNDWQVKWVVKDSTADVLDTLKSSKAHIAAAGLTQTAQRDAQFKPGESYLSVKEQVVCPQKHESFPKKPAGLQNVTLKVAENTSYLNVLNHLKIEFPELTYEEVANTSTEMLLADAAEEGFCVVADSNIADKSRRLFPELSVAFNLPAKGQLVWYMPEDANELTQKVKQWMTSKDGRRAIERMVQKHYAYVSAFDFVDLRTLKRNIKKRLPKYKKYFIEAEEDSGIPADLLAAVSYQESHWNPDAVSPTGVKGVMMLTQNTAEALGVSDRSDPEEAIVGGARYLKDLFDRLPDSIPYEDRLYQAMASYNIGRAHLLDIRHFAQTQGKNADSWPVVRKLLPLKSNKNYYPKMKYGYARGNEPVIYVNRIRNYRDVIRQSFSD